MCLFVSSGCTAQGSGEPLSYLKTLESDSVMDDRASRDCEIAHRGGALTLVAAADSTLGSVRDLLQERVNEASNESNFDDGAAMDGYAAICVFEGAVVRDSLDADRLATYELPDFAGSGYIDWWDVT
jgi:hypothetical protein